jgi:glycosyltransferase involved in cell wall biosynthesis
VRIALDARLIGLPGIGRMIAGLTGGLREIGADPLVLWPAGRPRDWLRDARTELNGSVERVAARPFLPVEQFVVPRLLRRRSVDVHHAPHFNVPYLTRVPVVLTVHDLFPYLAPRNARSRTASVYYRIGLPLAVRRASAVVAISTYAAEQLRDTLGIAEDKLHVIDHGIDHERFHPTEESEIARVRAVWSLEDTYVLYVGTAKTHKNLRTLLQAMGPDLPQLVIAGASAAEVAQSAGADLLLSRSRVKVIGRVPDRDLPALYSGATAVLLPSPQAR